MIYDIPITILKLPNDIGTPLQGKLQPTFTAFCGEKEVYHRRFWESVQAGSRIDTRWSCPSTGTSMPACSPSTRVTSTPSSRPSSAKMKTCSRSPRYP